jgi:Dienelactone hydrolase family
MAMAREAALPVHGPPYDVPIVSCPGADPEPYGGGPRPLTLVVVSRAGDTLADRAHTEGQRVSTRDLIGYDAVSEPGRDPDRRLLQPSCGGRLLSGAIVIMEAFELVDHIKDVARRFAEQGYRALAPERYTREGSPDPSQRDSVLQTMVSVPDPQAVADLEGALAYLKRRPDANGKVGAIGFCAGGRYTLLLACQSTDLDAAVDSAGGFII